MFFLRFLGVGSPVTTRGCKLLLIPALKLTDSHLKMDGWNTRFLLGPLAYFQVLLLLVSESVPFSNTENFGISALWKPCKYIYISFLDLQKIPAFEFSHPTIFGGWKSMFSYQILTLTTFHQHTHSSRAFIKMLQNRNNTADGRKHGIITISTGAVSRISEPSTVCPQNPRAVLFYPRFFPSFFLEWIQAKSFGVGDLVVKIAQGKGPRFVIRTSCVPGTAVEVTPLDMSPVWEKMTGGV